MCRSRASDRRVVHGAAAVARSGAARIAWVLALLAAPVLATPVLPPALQQQAASLPENERTRLIQRLAALRAMPEERREALRKQVEHWDGLPLAERRARREAWRAWDGLSDADRARMRRAAAGFAQLPPERQQALVTAFSELDSFERAGWLLGPDLGADWPALHALFALVPAGQRGQLLQALRAMDAPQRADLAVLAQRTPPEQRQALRDTLLSTPPENRAAWLRRQVDP